jgi:hypothetical protein
MKKYIKIMIRLLYGLLALAVIFVFVYFFGSSATRTIVGGDIKLALSYATWIDKFFPNIPYWYPLSGAGESIVLGYHMLSIYTAVAFKFLSGVSLYKSFIIFQFLPLVLAPVSIYLYSSLRLKNQTVGLISAVFYTLMPLSWTWLFDWGFYAQNFSLPLFTIGFLCFDWYFEEYFNDPLSKKTKIGLLSFSVLFVITVMSHATTGLHLLLSTATFGLIYSLFKKGKRTQNIGRGVIAVLIAMTSAIALSAFFLVPFVRYSMIANKEGLNNINPLLLVPNPPQMFFQTTPIESETYYKDASYIYRNISIPVLIWLLAVLGAVVAVFKNRKIFTLFILALLGSMLLVFPEISAFVIRALPFTSVIFDKRSWVPSILTFGPIVAAYFLYMVAGVVYLPLLWLAKRIKQKFISLGVLAGHHLLVTVTAIVLAIISVYLFRNVSVDGKYKNIIVNYGPNSFTNIYDVWKNPSNPCTNIRLVSEGGTEKCKSFSELVQVSGWPRISIPGTLPRDINEEDIFSKLPKSKNGLNRIDISPNVGGLSKDMGIYSDVSQVNSYTYQLSLIHSMWGYMQSVMYFTSINNQPSVVNELSDLFGINKVFLYDKPDVYEKYKGAGWVNTYTKNLDEVETGWQIWDSPKQNQLASFLIKPRVLVIGDPKIGIYDNIFRLAIQGALPYEKGITFQGTKNVDDYNISDLKKFDLVILNGYSYKNKNKALGNLDTYVKEGGSLYMDTGWQYVAKDYQIESAPGFFPSDSLKWMDIGMADKFEVMDTGIDGNVDASKFSPLIWNGVSWGVSSTGSGSDLRQWVKPVLVSNGYPLVTMGQYGKGKVVWSGFNLASHILSNKNDEELKLLGNLWSYLLPTGSGSGEVPLSISRDNPDVVKIVSNGGTDKNTILYFREPVYPNWGAELVSGGKKTNLKIYSAGPGFMAILLPKLSTGDQIVFSFNRDFSIVAGWVITFFTLIVLIIMFTPFGTNALHLSKYLERFSFHPKKEDENEDY